MGETRRKKERRAPIRPTEKLPPITTTKDRALAEKQRDFCRTVIDEMLKDETSLSFSKPVNELWDMSVLQEYFEKISNPMDLGTVRTRLSSTEYDQPDTNPPLFDPNAYRVEVRLVFLNAISYNGKSSDLGRLATKFLHFIDSEMVKLPESKPTDNGTPADDTPAPSSKSTEKNADADAEDADDDNKSREEGDAKSSTDKQMDADDSSTKPTENDDDKEKGGDADMEDKAEAKSDDKMDEDHDDQDTPASAADPNEDMDDESKEPTTDDSERERLEREISTLTKLRAHSQAAITDLELAKNAPLTYDENSKLRDDVEKLPWDLSQKVVSILRAYVDEALKESADRDPEYVTLEFSTVEPRLLREIEQLIRPDPRVEKEKKAIVDAEHDLEVAKRKLKRLNEGPSALKKKRSKKSR